jgi:hypothetical protein
MRFTNKPLLLLHSDATVLLWHTNEQGSKLEPLPLLFWVMQDRIFHGIWIAMLALSHAAPQLHLIHQHAPSSTRPF